MHVNKFENTLLLEILYSSSLNLVEFKIEFEGDNRRKR